MKSPLLFFFLFFSLSTFAQDGVLDASFGTGGKTSSNYIGDFGAPMPVVVQTDGKILQATSALIGGAYQTIVLRYNSNGGLDATFGNNGKYTSNLNGNNAALDLAIQTDGKIVLAGLMDSAGNNFFMVSRILPNGTIDASFGNNGRKIIPFNNEESIAYAVAIQGDGKIVVGGYAMDAAGNAFIFAMARLTSAGNIDNSFDTDGIQTTILNNTGYDAINDITIQADGKIVAAGISQNAMIAQLAVVRYTSAGVLDNSFGTNGKYTVSIDGHDSQAYSVATQPDGKIVVSGSYLNSEVNANLDFVVMRFTTAGSPDPGFGSAGVVTTGVGTEDDEAYSVAVQLDGKIVAGGDIYVPSQIGFDIGVVRYTAAGVLDNTFGTGGKAIIDMNSGSDDEYGMIASQGTKMIVGVLQYDASDNEIPAIIRLGNSSAFYNAVACPGAPAAPTASISGTTLSSSSSGNNQWYLNGVAIAGATGQTYTATVAGSYTVTVTVGSCVSAASNAVVYTVTGISSPVFDAKLRMAPNPVTNKMVINYTGTGKLSVEVMDLSGRIVLSRKSFTNNSEIDFSAFTNGTYLVRIVNEKTHERVQKMIVKQ